MDDVYRERNHVCAKGILADCEQFRDIEERSDEIKDLIKDVFFHYG